ncbi:DUF6889 family protein [Carnimonas bestiolae]|uniref:DUF6889 family protein n=1 Tax=Carnimonas bestiolae TaxID=3402172 RepID=UPI003F4A9CFA
MPGGQEYILRAALKFGISQRELDTGEVDLARIALLNDYLDMMQDNEARIAKWRAQK